MKFIFPVLLFMSFNVFAQVETLNKAPLRPALIPKVTPKAEMIPRPPGGCGGWQDIGCSTNVSPSGRCCAKNRPGLGG